MDVDRFPLPDIPNGWTPNPRRVWESNKENREVDSQQLPQGPVDHHAWKTGITADQVCRVKTRVKDRAD